MHPSSPGPALLTRGQQDRDASPQVQRSLAREQASLSVRAASRHRAALRPLLVYATAAAYVPYAIWRLYDTLPPDGLLPFRVFAAALIAVELVCAYITVTGIEFPKDQRTRPTLRPFTVRERQRTDEVDSQLEWYGDRSPRTDIFIATYNEPWEVLERTLVGALHQSYPNAHIWILDDGRRSWLQHRAEELNVGYLSRPDNAHYKAGNINHAIRALRSRGIALEFIALLDADFIPRPEFLRRTLALMHAGDVGLVQTPQCFYNADPFQRWFGIENWPEEQRWWFDMDQTALDASSSALCCGTACLVRMQALDAIGGGFPTESVTEDTLCSIRLAEKGWLTVYLSERLALGLAAEGLHEWFTQRARWLRGELQNRRLGGLPRNPIDRVHYWLSFLQLPLLTLRELGWSAAFIVYWYTGLWVIDASPATTVALIAPIWLSHFAWGWLSAGRKNFLVTTSQFRLQQFLRLWIPLGAVFSSKPVRFEVTAKAQRHNGIVFHWRAMRWHLAIVIALLGGVAYRTSVGWDTAGAGAVWSWAILLASLYLIAETLAALAPTVEWPQRRRHDRYTMREAVRLSAGTDVISGTCLDLSVEGLCVTTSLRTPAPEPLAIDIPDVGWVPASCVRAMPDGRLAFRLHPEAAARRALIRKIYCSGLYVPLPDVWRLRDGVAAFLRTCALLPFWIAAHVWRGRSTSRDERPRSPRRLTSLEGSEPTSKL